VGHPASSLEQVNILGTEINENDELNLINRIYKLN
jgi:hypothetical protein